MEQLIARIKNVIPVEFIYKHTYKNGGTDLEELVILMRESKKIHYSEAVPLVNLALANSPGIHCRLYYTNDAKRGLKKGSLAFYSICQPENLIYRSADAATELHTPDLTPQFLMKKSKGNFENELKKASSFKDGAEFYVEKGNLPMAAFMYHQVIEICYRAAETLVIGCEKISHSIRNYQKLLQRYMPQLGSLFDEDDEDQMVLLEKLDEAYKAVRYEDHYHISEEQIILFRVKAQGARTYAEGLYYRMFNDFSIKFATDKGPEKLASLTGHSVLPNNVPGAIKQVEPVVQRIIDQIKSRCKVSRIYQIGYRSCSISQEGICDETKLVKEHFDLLVIIDGVCNQEAFDIQSVLNNNDDIPASMSLWMHSGASVEESLADIENGFFFHYLLSSGHLLYRKTADPEFENLLDYDESRVQYINSYTWNNRYIRAKALMHAASNITEDDTEVVELWLLHQAMEQVCLAFIFVMIGYRPNQHSLNHLFSICRCISPMIDQVFPTENGPDRDLFKILINSGRKLRDYSYGMYDHVDIGMLQRRCRAWMAKAKEIVSL